MRKVSYRDSQSCLTLDVFSRPQVVQETSVVAYRELVTTGEASSQAQHILGLLVGVFPDGLTNQEIEQLSGVRINAVCGRVNELRKLQFAPGKLLVMLHGTKTNPITGVQNIVWTVNPEYVLNKERMVV